ncbi:MAG: leucyl/phenylalanyl-tRNA--protein transferase [Psychrobium sp.]|nr:leucyl/phenylalanyl-tRNA--protein transferase [Psychrobium sp.]
MSQLTLLSDHNTHFPSTNSALSEPNGLLAIGGDLTSERLISAYQQGIFPWYNDNDPIMWWSPDPRCVFFTDQFHCNKTFRRFLNKKSYQLTINQCFETVISQCAAPRPYEKETWINQDIISAYTELNQRGVAHSIEVWHQEQLIGGLYGLFINNVFCGESMFSLRENASKTALYALCQHLNRHGVDILDCQVPNDHLLSLGAQQLSRDQFLQKITQQRPTKLPVLDWAPQVLCYD